MPLRKFFARRGAKYPAVYSNALLALGVVVCMAVAVAIPIQLNQKALERERSIKAASDERSRQATCALIDTISQAYREEDGTLSPAGRKIGKAWVEASTAFDCARK